MTEKEPGILINSPLMDDAHSRADIKSQLDLDREERHREDERWGKISLTLLITLMASSCVLLGIQDMSTISQIVILASVPVLSYGASCIIYWYLNNNYFEDDSNA